MHKRYPRPLLANGDTVSTAAEALETIRYLTGEWLANPVTFGQWGGGAYMESLHDLATRGLDAARTVEVPVFSLPAGVLNDFGIDSNYSKDWEAQQRLRDPAVTYAADGFVTPPATFVNPDSGDCDAPHVAGGS